MTRIGNEGFPSSPGNEFVSTKMVIGTRLTMNAAAPGSGERLLITGSGTGADYISITNDGCTFACGVERSVATGIFLGTLAYAGVIGTVSNTAFQIATNNTVRVTVGAAGQMGFFGVTAVVKQTSGADLTNNVAAGGTDDTIANYTDLSVYANDAAAIRNDIHQLARKLKQVNDGLRAYGLLT